MRLRMIGWAAAQVGRAMVALDVVDAWLDRWWGRLAPEEEW